MPFSAERVCNRIADKHSTPIDPPPPAGSEARTSSTMRWVDLAKRKLSFVADDGTFVHGEDLYVPDTALQFADEGLQRELKRRIICFHGDYLKHLEPRPSALD